MYKKYLQIWCGFIMDNNQPPSEEVATQSHAMRINPICCSMHLPCQCEYLLDSSTEHKFKNS